LVSPNIVDIFDVIPMPKTTDAHIRHDNKNPEAGIVITACGDGDNECCFKNDCKILDSYDDFIKKNLDVNVVAAIEVRFCGHYRAKKFWSNYDSGG
jgi:hypothetical protein